MPNEPLDLVPLGLLFLGAIVLGALALEVGYRFGRYRHARSTEEKEAPVGAMVGSILGLLAFLLAFTFGLAATRFDQRREAVLQEANAIGTTYLRARLLLEPHQAEAARLLKEYVQVRIDASKPDQLESAIQRSEALHELLWTEGVQAAHKNPNPVQTGLFLQSLNEMIDLHAKRMLVALRSRVPSSIWIGLLLLAILGMGSIGYQSGIAATRRSPAMLGMVLAFAGVLYLIADLDRGFEGFLKVNQQALFDLQRSMQATKQ